MIKLEPQGTPCLLLDLDGTVRRSRSKNTFIQSPDDQELIEGVSEALAHYRAQNWLIIGVSNQGGCTAINPKTGKPYKTITDAIAQMQFTLLLLPQMQTIYFCPDFKGYFCYKVGRDGATRYDHSQKAVLLPVAYYDSGVDGYEWKLDEQLNFRKPGAGMAELICDAHSISSVWMVGDRDEDRDFAQNAGIPFWWADIWQRHFRGEDMGDLSPDIKSFLERK